MVFCVGIALVVRLACILFLKLKFYKEINNQSLISDDNTNDEESTENNLDCFQLKINVFLNI